MAKDKTKTGVPNKHLHARISYLQQASTLLAVGQAASHAAPPASMKDITTQGPDAPTSPSQQPRENTSQDLPERKDPDVLNFSSFGGLPLQLSYHLVQVARKSQIRLHPSIKHSLCKRCSTPLIEGQTCTKRIENLSKGGRKPQAEVLVMKCACCGAAKRWPVGAKRQQRKTERKAEGKEVNGTTSYLEGTQKDG